jgi:spore coat polysaccharide biosynthesis protein SpsF
MIETKALDVAVHIKKQSDTEIWGPFVNRPDFFNIFNLIVENSPFTRDTRLTLDYPEDYELIKTIYNHFQSKNIIGFKDVFSLLSNEDSFLEINKKHTQQKPSDETLEKINKNFEDNVKIGKQRAGKILKILNPSYNEMKILV